MPTPTTLLVPKRGTVDTGLIPVSTPERPQTAWVQVERTRDEYSGKHLMEYYISAEFDFNDLPACTGTGGVSGGAGTKVSLGELPKKLRLLGGYLETVTAWVNDAASEEIDGVFLGSDALLADADITAAAGFVDLAAAATPIPPKIYATPQELIVYFAGAATKVYTAGKSRLYLKVLS